MATARPFDLMVGVHLYRCGGASAEPNFCVPSSHSLASSHRQLIYFEKRACRTLKQMHAGTHRRGEGWLAVGCCLGAGRSRGRRAAHFLVIFTSGRSAASSALQALQLPVACTSARRGAVATTVASAAAAAAAEQVGLQHAQQCLVGS